MTNTPQQALVGLNEPGMHARTDQALGQRERRGQSGTVFWIVFPGPPDVQERAKCLDFISNAPQGRGGPAQVGAANRRKVDLRMNTPNGQAEFLQTRHAVRSRLAAGGFVPCRLPGYEQGVARPARTHFAPRAKGDACLPGGPSHVDTFDPKPLLTKLDGRPMPADIIRNHEFAMIKPGAEGEGITVEVSPHGQSGIEISSCFTRRRRTSWPSCVRRTPTRSTTTR